MKVSPTAIADVLLIDLPCFGDERGYFMETFNTKLVEAAGLPVFVQDNESLSRVKGTLRGLHLQAPPFTQAKLVRCVSGAIVDVAVDVRRQSATFGRHVAVELAAEKHQALFVPAGFAHGFCTLTTEAMIQYKVDAVYSAAHERTLAWDDPEVGVDWPVGAPVLSEKDAAGADFTTFTTELEDVDWTARA